MGGYTGDMLFALGKGNSIRGSPDGMTFELVGMR